MSLSPKVFDFSNIFFKNNNNLKKSQYLSNDNKNCFGLKFCILHYRPQEIFTAKK